MIKFDSDLFINVQENRVFPDSKTFVDCIPNKSEHDILTLYKAQKEPFSLKKFVLEHFTLPETRCQVPQPSHLPLNTYIEQKWNELLVPMHASENSTLIPLPHPHVVPGGRFRECYYWDTYFTVIGLIKQNRLDLACDLTRNLISLIGRFGHVPNGNRTYYLSRSQPPYLALILSALWSAGEKTVPLSAYAALQKEYAFWMDGIEHNLPSYRRVVRVEEGGFLNRYYDDQNTPRPESYFEDKTLFDHTLRDGLYRDLRAACESGWDFSSRWLAGDNLGSIQTTNLVPIDLNALLFHMENTLSQLALLQSEKDKSADYKRRAEKRRELINKYLWDEDQGFYFDYNFETNSKSPHFTLAPATALFVKLSTPNQASKIASRLETEFLFVGGLVTTLTTTGQQWDDPNAWAPLQWHAIEGLREYHMHELSQKIAKRFLNNVETNYKKTGLLFEKYNARDIEKLGSGGEYYLQEGFSWTNGVITQLI